MRHRTIIGLAFAALLAVCVPLYASGQAQKGPRKRHEAPHATQSPVQKAEAAIEKKDYSAAESLLNEEIGNHPKNYQAWFYLGYVFNATGRKPQAIDAYRKAVAIDPALLESNLNLGILLVENGNPEASKYLLAATQAKPTPEQTKTIAVAWSTLADSLEKTDTSAAITAYQHAAELLPKDPAPHVELGRLLEKRGAMASAEKEYRQALVLDPKSSNALAQLSNIYMRSKRLPEAETMLREFIQLNPKNAAAHLQLGRVLAVENKNDEALAELNAALELSPGDVDALSEIAGMQLSAKQYPAAEESYRKLLALKPQDAELHYGLGSALLRQLKYSEAKREFLETVKLKSDWGEAYGDLALAASNDKDYNLALRALAARGRFLPDSANTVWLRATVYDHLGALKEASENYKQFLSMAAGKYPDREWQARHRLIAIDPDSRRK